MNKQFRFRHPSRVLQKIIYVFLFHFLTINLCIDCTKAQCGYLIVKVQSQPSSTDNKQEAAQSLHAVDETDPHWTELYTILLRNEWPTSQLYSTNGENLTNLNSRMQSELGKLNTSLGSKDFHYEAVFIPDTIQDLGLLVDAHNTTDKSRMLSPYDMPDHTLHTKYVGENGEWGFAKNYHLGSHVLDTNSQFEALFKKAKDQGSPHSQWTALLKDYFLKINSIASPFHGQHNRSLFQKLWRVITSKGHGNGEMDSSKKFEQTILEKRNDIISEFLKHLNEHFDSTFSGDSRNYLPLLSMVAELEYEAYQNNKILLFRGTTGVPVGNRRILDSGRWNLDSSDTHGSKEKTLFGTTFTNDMSLSYGSTLLAGLVKDRGACAFTYFRDGKFAFFKDPSIGYVLSLDLREIQELTKVGDQMQLFYIPPLGALGRVFGEGEFFHPRTVIGAKDLSASISRPERYTFRGIKDNSVSNLSNFMSTEFLLNPHQTSHDLNSLLNHLIANHAKIVTFYGHPFQKAEDQEKAKQLILSQKEYAESSSKNQGTPHSKLDKCEIKMSSDAPDTSQVQKLKQSFDNSKVFNECTVSEGHR